MIELLLLIGPSAVLAADLCDQVGAAKTVYLDSDGTAYKNQAETADYPKAVLLFGQELRLSCKKTSDQSQALNWNTPKACADLIDRRPNDPSQTYFNGPNDPRRCLITYGIKGFEAHLRAFLEARNFKDDGSGHRFRSSEIQGLMQILASNGECKQSKPLAARFDCYLRGFEALSKKINKLDTVLASDAKETKTICEAFRATALNTQEVDLLARVSKNRQPPSGYARKNYPAYLDCHAYDLPYLFKGCSGTSNESKLPPLTDVGMSCLRQGVKRLGGNSQFNPPHGWTNPLRDRLAELRARAIELSELTRQCVLDFKAEALVDASLKPANEKESKERCLVADFEDFRAATIDPVSWLRKLQAKEKELEAEFNHGNQDDQTLHTPKAQPDCPQPITLAQKDDRVKIDRLATFAQEAVKQIADNTPKPNESNVPLKPSEASTAPGVEADVDLNAEILALIEGTSPKLDEKAKEAHQAEVVPAAASLPPELQALQSKMQLPLQNALDAEKKIPASIRDKAKLAQYRSTAELILAAQTELGNFKNKKDSSFDFGQFFLETEANDAFPSWSLDRYQTLLARYFDKKEEYENFTKNLEGTFLDRVRKLMVRINQDFLKDYTASNALLSNFLDGKGGNCEAETKFLDTVFRDLKLKPEGDWVLGAQVFDDHVQPVLFNKKTRHVLVLHTMQEYSGLIAPIFHPEVFLYGYLKAKLASTIASVDDLLIEGFNADEKRWAQARGGKGKSRLTNTNLALPKTGTNYADGPNPEHGKINVGSSGQSVESAKNFKPQRGERKNPTNGVSLSIGLVFNKHGAPETMSLEDLKDPRPGITENDIQILNRFSDTFSNPEFKILQIETMGDKTLVFRNRIDEQRYHDAIRRGDKENATAPILEEVFTSILQSKKFEDCKILLSDPLRVQRENWTMQRVEVAKNVLNKLVLTLMGKLSTSNTFSHSIADFHQSEDGSEPWQKKWVQRHPELEELLKLQDARDHYMNTHLDDMLKLYSTLKPDTALFEALHQGWAASDLSKLVNKINGNQKHTETFFTFYWNKTLYKELREPSQISFLDQHRSQLEIKPTLESKFQDSKKKKKVQSDLEIDAAQKEIEQIGIEKSQAQHEQNGDLRSLNLVHMHIETSQDRIDDNYKDQQSRKKENGTKGNGKDAIAREAGPREAKGENSFTRHGMGQDLSGLSSKPEPKAKISILALHFERILENAILECNDKTCTVEEINKTLSRWTPNLSIALLKEFTGHEDLFYNSLYRKILRVRDPKTFTLPGPLGEKIPRDLALLWLRLAPDSLEHREAEYYHFNHGPLQDPFDKQSAFDKKLTETYGSIAKYKAILREALRKELLNH